MKDDENEIKSGNGNKSGSKASMAHAELERLKRVAKDDEKKEKDERTFLDTAMLRLKKAIDHDEHNRKASLDDLRFSNGIDQWDERVRREREKDGRPCLQFDLLTENISQVVGDQRHNKIRGKVRPVGSEADPEIARIRQGIISNVEYLSSAERIYDYSMEMVCRGGYAAWEIGVRYTEENPFLQEMYMQRVENPHTVYLGPGHDECHADAKYGFKLEKMAVKDFEAEYPNKQIPGDSIKVGSAMGYEHWWDGECVTIADYYVMKNKKVAMALLSDGRVMREEDAKGEVKDAKDVEKARKVAEKQVNMMGEDTSMMGSKISSMSSDNPSPMMNNNNPLMGNVVGPPMMGSNVQPVTGNTADISSISVANPSPSSIAAPFPSSQSIPGIPLPSDTEILHIAKVRDTYIPVIKHYTISAMEILSENGVDGEDFPGSFIPLILVQGPEINIEGKSYVRSFIRPGRDPQRNYNYWVSAAAESVALAPKAEWVGTARQFAGYENDYASSNMKNFPMLKYNIDDEYAPFFPAPPMRVAVKDPPIGIFTEMTNAKIAVKDALGMHSRDVGDVGPERSGAAINAVQRPSDIGSFQFFDNLKRAIEHSCRVMNSMISEVYDSERDVRIRDETDSTTFVPINTTVSDALKRVKEDPDKYQGMNINKMRGAVNKYGRNARFNDLTVGKYDVISTTGPAYATQRAESSEQMLRLATVDKRVMEVGGDLIVRSMDFQHSDELADRLEKTLPPGMAKLKEGERPPPPTPPSPQDQLLMQMNKTEVIKQQKEMEKMKVEKLKLKVEMVKIYKETKETDSKIREQIIKVLQELTNPEPIPGERGWGEKIKGNKISEP